MSDHQLRKRRGRLANWPRLQRLAAWFRRIGNPSLRAVHRLRREEAGRLLQPFPDTSLDRHPALFAFARDQLTEVSEPRILSFGCSTGEEPITLNHYIPDACIDALEINPRSLAIAKGKAQEASLSRINFQLGSTPPSDARYDAIFCLSVLRHGELDAIVPQSCSAILPFARFSETVAAFDRVLKPGGWLFIWGSNFRFELTPEACNYEPMIVPGTKGHIGAVYGPDDRLIDCNGNSRFAFRKLREMVAEEVSHGEPLRL
jgi:SAM-dependent methyltransferase